MTQIAKNQKPKADISSMIYGKIPPQAPEMEEAVLGACMLERETFEQVMEIIYSHECFYVDAHQKIYEAMCHLYNSGSPVDLLTITAALQKAGNLEKVGGAYYLTELTMSVLSSGHVIAHALHVMEKHMLRQCIRICGEAVGDGYDQETDVFELLGKLEESIKGITSHIMGKDDISSGDSYKNVLEEYNKQKISKSSLTGISTGYDDLDEIMGGLKKPSLIFIAAKPSEGKTALMLNIAYNAARKGNRGKLYSLETGATNLTRRMAASHSSIPFDMLSKGLLNDFQEQLLQKALPEFHKLKLPITYKIFFIEDLEKSVRKEKKRNPDLSFIAIDFIQLLKMRNPGKLNKFEIVGEVSRRLKLLSAELDLPIIALSQLNRDVNKNTNKRPEPHNLANSSELEQNADVIIFIHYQPTGEMDDFGKEVLAPCLIVAKNKDGRCGDVKIKFNADLQQWLNYSDFSQNTLPSYVAAAGFQTRNPSEPNKEWNWEEHAV